MKSMLIKFLTAIFLLGFAVILSCGGDDDNPVKTFQPIVVIGPDSFTYSVSDGSNLNTSTTHSWNNTGSRAAVQHNSQTASGSAVLTIYDDDDIQVYSATLDSSGTELTSIGIPGIWTIEVVYSNFTGTVLFRLDTDS